MKILYLSVDNYKIHYNHWYGFDFILSMNDLPDVDVKLYGQGLEDFYPLNLATGYSSTKTLKEIHEKFPFDVIILSNRNRMMLNEFDKILNNLENINCVKVAIEGDIHHHKKNLEWFNNGITAIFHRHKSNTKLGKNLLPKLNHFWLPCSVNDKNFYDRNNQRLDKVCFIGHYPTAVLAIKNIPREMIDCYQPRYEKDYLDILQKYKIYLNYSYKANIDNAKAFEIIASGGLLLTNECENGFKELFGKNTYFTYKNDCSDLIQQINKILNNRILQKQHIDNGVRIINTKHNHLQRSKEFIKNLKTL